MDRNIQYFNKDTEQDAGIIDLDLDPSILMFPGAEMPDEEQVPQAEPDTPVNISDALIRCMRDIGRVDIHRIAATSGRTEDEVIEALRGSIFCNPEKWDYDPHKGWEMADEYLSGNLRDKLIRAKLAAKRYPHIFSINVESISSILPATLSTESIYVTLGSPWLPTDIIEGFVNYLIQPDQHDRCQGIRHDEETGSWDIPDKSRYWNYVRNRSTYGTERIDAIHIIENTLNMKTIKVTDEVRSGLTRSGTRRVINQEETAAALEKQSLIIGEFRKWIWMKSTRAERVRRIYEDKFGYNAVRRFDGRFLDFPGMSEDIQLRPYQKNGAARIIFTPNTLLAHDVGAGKTFIMIAAAMELKRLGMSERNMFVVPNNLVEQWKSLFLVLYPGAVIQCVTPPVFTPARRNRTLQRIREEDSDAIIIAYSCFDNIPLSRKYYIDELRAERDAMLELKEKKKDKVTGRFQRKLERLDKELGAAAVSKDPAREVICFDDLGITRLFVDEAHNYKNVPVDTTITGVFGISQAGSVKCDKMLGKVRHVQNTNGGGGVVMATGTPITNSITDIYVFQQYLQSGELELLGLQTFHSWVAMFAEKTTEFEIAVDTNSYRLTNRFSRFHNIPELTSILASIADFHMLDSTEGLPEFKGYTDVLVPRSAELRAYLEQISERADRVHEHIVKRKDDNMLKITTDGRKAALDVRLVREDGTEGGQALGEWTDIYRDIGRCKVAECAEQVAIIYRKTAEDRLAQLVFCDISTPKAGFNIYDEMKRLLLGYGIPAEEIAYIHDAVTDAKREKLFARVRNGDIRILIGSTFKLGLGVNIQDRLIALHHLDVPWRPADMVQREGRILRAGNINPEIRIFRYITEGSFDAYSWQLLETKQRFIVDLLSGSVPGRSGSEVDDVVLNYAEVKALALGNPLLKSRVETRNELTRLSALRKKSIENRMRLEQRYSELPDLIKDKEFELKICRSDAQFIESKGKDVYRGLSFREKMAMVEWRRYVKNRLNEELRRNVMKEEDRNILEYRGFSIVMPAGMDPERPFVYLVHEGRYRVDIGDKDGGALIRIDNYLEKLDERAEMLRIQLAILRKEVREIERELSTDDGYAEQIEEVSARLERIDDELGVSELRRQFN